MVYFKKLLRVNIESVVIEKKQTLQNISNQRIWVNITWEFLLSLWQVLRLKLNY